MKILFVSPKFPYPPNNGGAIRIFNLLKEVSKYHDTSLLTFVTNEEQFKLVNKLEKELCPVNIVWHSLDRRWKAHLKYFLTPIPYYRNVSISPEMSLQLRHLSVQNDYDIVQIESLTMAHFVEDTTAPVTVLDMHNVESLLYNRMRKILPVGKEKVLGLLDDLKLKKYEKNQVRKFNTCLATSDIDQDILAKSSNCNIYTIPNGVETDFFQPGIFKEERESLVFVGSYTYYPNVDAVVYFCEKILPLITRFKKRIKFFVVGRNPPNEIKALDKANGVIVTDFVEDVREYIGRATVYVVPLRSGSGTRLKILEAWAMGKAIVSTSLGVEGLCAKHNDNVIIADDPTFFAESVIDLLEDKNKRIALGSAGRETVEQNYEWSLIGQQLCKIYEGLLNR
ncbi:glycosyltransferase [Thermodesulfobacteriota bacterium]